MCCGGIDKAKQKRENQAYSGFVATATPPAPFTPDPYQSDNTNMQRALELRDKKHKMKFQHG